MEEAAFNAIVVPVAKEVGYDISMDDRKALTLELNSDEMQQVAGGDTVG